MARKIKKRKNEFDINYEAPFWKILRGIYYVLCFIGVTAMFFIFNLIDYAMK